MKINARILLLVLTTLALSPIYACNRSDKEAPPSPTPAPATAEPQVGAAAQGMSTKGKIVAYVNGRPVYEKDLGPLSLEDALVNEVLYEAGLSEGMEKDFQEQIENYKKQLIVNRMRLKILANVDESELTKTVTNEDIERYYKENESKYTYPHVVELMISDRKVAEEIRSRALKGEDFEKIAKEYEDQPGLAVRFYDWKYTKKFNNNFDKLEVGAVSNLIPHKKHGYLVRKIVDIRKISLDKVRAPIKHALIAKKKAQAVKDYAEKLKKEHNINVRVVGEPEQ